MFNRRRRAEAIRQEFDQIAATAWHPSPQELTGLLREAQPDPGPAGRADETGGNFLPPSLRAPGDRQVAGEMMQFPWPLEIDGTVRICPVCGVDRDWLVLCAGPDIWLRCRSGHETPEPALNGTWFKEICGPVEEVHQSKRDGIAKMGFDGTFSGIIFPS
jgi:hypothetical protein